MSTEIFFKFTWLIENYSKWPGGDIECLSSPQFRMDILDTPFRYCYLELHPQAHRTHSLDSVLHLEGDTCCPGINVSIILTLVSPDGVVIKTKKANKAIFNETENHCTLFGIMDIIKLRKEMSKWSEDLLTVILSVVSKDLQLRKQSLIANGLLPIEKMPTGCTAKTKINVDRLELHWFVPYSNSSEWISKKEFVLFESSKINFILTAPQDDVLINVELLNSMYYSIYVECELTLLNLKSLKRHSRKSTHKFVNRKNTWDFPTFFTRSEINQNKDSYSFFKTPGFELVCNLLVSNRMIYDDYVIYTHDVPEQKFLKFRKSQPRINATTVLESNFLQMFMDKNYCDIKLKAENVEFPAHKCILSARSPVFAVMFQQDMLENRTNLIDIPDLTKETLMSLLKFIYSGSVKHVDCESTLNLILAAEKYQIASLKEDCSYFLKSVISSRNASSVLMVADLVQDQELKMYALCYIKSHFASIVNTIEWENFIETNKALASDSLEQILCFNKDLSKTEQEPSPSRKTWHKKLISIYKLIKIP